MTRPLLKITFIEPTPIWEDGICSIANYIVLEKLYPSKGLILYNHTGNQLGAIIYLDLIKSIEFIQPNEL